MCHTKIIINPTTTLQSRSYFPHLQVRKWRTGSLIVMCPRSENSLLQSQEAKLLFFSPKPLWFLIGHAASVGGWGEGGRRGPQSMKYSWMKGRRGEGKEKEQRQERWGTSEEMWSDEMLELEGWFLPPPSAQMPILDSQPGKWAFGRWKRTTLVRCLTPLWLVT